MWLTSTLFYNVLTWLQKRKYDIFMENHSIKVKISRATPASTVSIYLCPVTINDPSDHGAHHPPTCDHWSVVTWHWWDDDRASWSGIVPHHSGILLLFVLLSRRFGDCDEEEYWDRDEAGDDQRHLHSVDIILSDHSPPRHHCQVQMYKCNKELQGIN